MSLDVSIEAARADWREHGATGVAQTGEELPDRPSAGACSPSHSTVMKMELCPRGPSFDAEASAAFVDLRRRRIKPDGRAADDAVETVVQEDDAALVDLWLRSCLDVFRLWPRSSKISAKSTEKWKNELEDLLPGAEACERPAAHSSRPPRETLSGRSGSYLAEA